MSKLINHALFSALLTAPLISHAHPMKLVGIWTGENNYSSAPSPTCECDLDLNVADCPKQFTPNSPVDICYDEYIPSESNGYVHAQVFKKSE